MNKVCGKNAVIFGGAGGMSMEINKILLKNGIANLVISDIQEPHQELKDLMNNHKNIFYEKGSITDKDFVASVFKKYFDQLGYIDILINAAGIMGESNVNLLMQINTVGPMLSCKEAMKYMGKNRGGKGGVIINIASIAGFMIYSYYPIYCASKHALLAFSRCLMAESVYNLTGVKVHALCPGKTDTPMLENLQEALFFPELQNQMENFVKSIPGQPPSVVADGMMMAIQDDSNGAVWINDDGVSYKQEIPKFYKHDNAN